MDHGEDPAWLFFTGSEHRGGEMALESYSLLEINFVTAALFMTLTALQELLTRGSWSDQTRFLEGPPADQPLHPGGLALFPQRPLGAECFRIRGDEPLVSGDDGRSGNGFFGGETRENMACHPAGYGRRLVDDAGGMGRLEQPGSPGILSVRSCLLHCAGSPLSLQGRKFQPQR